MQPILPQQYADLRAFRQTIFSAVSKRRDAVINCCDALLERPSPRNIAELSLSPYCSRQWSSLYDALEEAVFEQRSLEKTFIGSALASHRARSVTDSPPWLMVVGDTTVLRRSSCRVVDGLRYAHTQTHEVNGRGIVIGHQYQLLRYASTRHSSWTMPLMSDRLGALDTAQSVAAAQLSRLSATLPDDAVCVSVFDGAFSHTAFIAETQKQRRAVIARLRHDRVLWHQPQTALYKGRGCHALYGDTFSCKDATTWRTPNDSQHFESERYGAVLLERWDKVLMKPPNNDAPNKHRRQKPLVVSLMRCTIHQGTKREHSIWLLIQFNDFPRDQRQETKALWQAWEQRATIEPSIKVCKQELSWTLPQTFTAAAADRWTCIVEIAFWHLFLVRNEATLVRFGWQKTDVPITPRHVRQSISAILFEVGSSAKNVRPRGKSPGWEKGRKRSCRKQKPVIYKGKKSTIRAA